MDGKTKKALLKKAKKYKKWTEGIVINPLSWNEDGTSYYLAEYTKKGETAAYALIGSNEENKEHAVKARQRLLFFSAVCQTIFDADFERIKVDFLLFVKPLSIQLNTQEQKVLDGRQAYVELWSLHQKLSGVIDGYKNFYNEDIMGSGQITESEIEKTVEAANVVTVHQYRIFKKLLDDKEILETFFRFLETTDGWKTLRKDQKAFFNDLTKDTDRLQKKLDKLNSAVDEDPEKMLQLNRERLIEESKKLIETKNVRYPVH